LDHVVKWNIYVVQGQSPMPAFEVFQRVWGDQPYPSLITLLFVSGLAQPDYLAEIEAVAVVPEE
jgi:enamine deaminase RidA (YjgF/YER057c/UK114 family)